MILLDETKKERRLRFSLILLIIALMLLVFFLRFNKIDGREQPEPLSPLFAVVEQSEGERDNPIVAIYEYTDGKHVLALYEIQRNNSFFFKTTAAVELKKPPEELASDSGEEGIWLKVSGKWRYLDNSLEEQKGSERTRNSVKKAKFHITKKEMETIITIKDKNYSLEHQANVISVFSLSAHKDLWLAVTDSDIKILH